MPDRAQEPAEGRGASLSLLGTVSGRLARDGARGFDVNERRGDELRADIYRKTSTTLDALAAVGAATPNRSGLPIIEVPLGRHEQIGDVGRFLFARGIYVTLAAYPLVPKHEVGFRIQVTASNTDEQVGWLVGVLGELAERFELQPAASARSVPSLRKAA